MLIVQLGLNFRCGRVDHASNFRDRVRWEVAYFSVAPDDALVFGKIDAKGFVLGHKTFNPLNVSSEFCQSRV